MNKTTGFIGFPDKKMNPIIVPDLFFSDLLPQIDNLAELKLTLHAFWLLNEQNGDLRYLRGDDLRSDTVLLESLAVDDLRPPLTILEDALERIVARNTMLRLEITIDGEDGNAVADPRPEQLIDDWYFMNTVKGRQTLALIRQGRLNEILPALPDEARLKVERPNIFVLYEQNIGIMSPMIADQLRDMEKTYPPGWIVDAFEKAISNNKHKLSYIQGILKRWETDGREDIGRENKRKGGTHERNGRPAGERQAPEGGYDLPDDLKDIVIG